MASPPRTATPPPTPTAELVIDLEPEGTSVPIEEPTRLDPSNDLEKEKMVAKTPAAPPQQPGPRTTPLAPEKKKPTAKPQTTQQQ